MLQAAAEWYFSHIFSELGRLKHYLQIVKLLIVHHQESSRIDKYFQLNQVVLDFQMDLDRL